MNYTFIKQGVKTERSEMDLILSESPGNGGSYRIQNTVFESRIIHSHHWWKQHIERVSKQRAQFIIYTADQAELITVDPCRQNIAKHFGDIR